MKAFDVMTWGAISIRADESILRAAQLMLEYKISGLPVIAASGHLVGIVTEAGLLNRSSRNDLANGRSVKEIMTPNPNSINGDAPLKDIVGLARKHRIKHLPVVDDEHVVGMVSRADILQAFVNFARAAKPQPEEAVYAATVRDDLSLQPGA